MSKNHGINLAMQTPFNEDGRVNYARWEELIDLYLDAGVHGIVLGSGTGQHPYLTAEECDRLFDLGAKRIAGRAKLICQTSALNMDEIILRTKKTQDLGADAVMILPPYFEGPADDDGMFTFYEDIDREIAVDIIGYNIPQATGISVSPELYGRLCTLEHFNYIKDSAGDLTTHQAFIQTGGNVLNGADPTTIYAFMAGAVGTIWGGANYMPREAVQLYNLVRAGDHAGALALWAKMIPSLIYIWHGDYNPAVKAACRIMGYEGGTVRRPIHPLSRDEESRLADTLKPLQE
jgi:4-hydroxy-tetrahydrodipicolinate synthase